MERRDFLKVTGTAAAAATLPTHAADHTIAFDGPDSLVHPPEWESLNPGYWQVKDGALRRRIKNYGDRARPTGFPYHYETHRRNEGKMPVDYDPSLPTGIIYRRDWKLRDAFQISATFTYHGPFDVRREGDDDAWKMFQSGYGQFGIAFGAKSIFESYGKIRNAAVVSWSDNNSFGFTRTPKLSRNKSEPKPKPVRDLPALKAGDQLRMTVSVVPEGNNAKITATLHTPDGAEHVVQAGFTRYRTQGYFGIAAQGLTDFSVSDIRLQTNQQPLNVGVADCQVCYPLGDSLKVVDGKWQVRFVGLFASDGERAEIRVADSATPAGGWQHVPVAGAADIVSNKWRRNTASIVVTLPENPASKTLYYTVWKDGKDVTADPRIGSDGSGEGSGYVGDVPASGGYVGRLPQLSAPYKLCGLSCHALTSGLQAREGEGFKILGGGAEWQFRDQPSVESYKHLEDYNFQIMVWEDDVWYMELMLYPPSTDDAYKVVTMSIAGPTSRWQMMRHWNIINPGDHDYGMDDVKGPEQIAIRLHDGLGQDRDYMRRNFQIVHHLITGAEEVDPLVNPKKWRAWKMPNRDFTLGIVDSRLWRSSQDTAMWDDEGWGHMRELYDRADPTRSLLGEEQFAWLQQLIRTDSSRLICLTGLNGLHTVWTGGKKYSNTDDDFAQRDRVAADYAGWVAAGADRVIELLGSRDGVVTVYGDVHNGFIARNTEHGVIECSFGPIGRSGGRSVIEGFGSEMKDYDGRPLEVTSLYHKTHANPTLDGHEGGQPFYWNFLEMAFDPRLANPAIGLRVRNLIDPPSAKPRGGAPLETSAASTGRRATCTLPALTTLPNADVRFVTLDGRPIRGSRSDAAGKVQVSGLIGPKPGERIMMTANDGQKADAQIITVS